MLVSTYPFVSDYSPTNDLRLILTAHQIIHNYVHNHKSENNATAKKKLVNKRTHTHKNVQNK